MIKKIFLLSTLSSCFHFIYRGFFFKLLRACQKLIEFIKQKMSTNLTQNKGMSISTQCFHLRYLEIRQDLENSNSILRFISIHFLQLPLSDMTPILSQRLGGRKKTTLEQVLVREFGSTPISQFPQFSCYVCCVNINFQAFHKK